MQGRKDQVTRQGSIDRNLGSLEVTRFTHQDYFRIVSQTGFEALGIVVSLSVVDLRLLDTCDGVLDRILERDDLPLAVIEVVEHRVERRRLS